MSMKSKRSMNKRSRTGKLNLALIKGPRLKVKPSRRGKTRGRDKVTPICPYTVDEKVLCFEPDPLKCKVLYEAKILKINSSVDSSGKTEFQYWVHFQGWNSSWDRFVADDLIVKDTEENRKLQEELSQLAAVQLKKGKHKASKPQLPLNEVPAKRQIKLPPVRRPGHDHLDLPFIQLEEIEGSEEGDDDEDDFNIQITLLEPFTKRLEFDYTSIHEENKFPRLPAPINLAQILEQFVKSTSFVKLERWHKKFKWSLVASRSVTSSTKTLPIAHTSSVIVPNQPPPEVKVPDELLKIFHEIEVLKQLAIDMTLMFDCYVENILLYNAEKERYTEFLRSEIKLKTSRSKVEVPEGLQFFELEEKTGKICLPKCSQLAVSGTPELDLKEVAGDCDDVLVEFLCRQRIWKIVQELASWSLVDWGVAKYARPSLIYGLPHLLRLLVKIPEILVKSDLLKSRIFQVSIFVNRLLSYVLAEFKEDEMVYEKL